MKISFTDAQMPELDNGSLSYAIKGKGRNTSKLGKEENPDAASKNDKIW